jgi:olefin beta-lactone synthetase
MDPRHPARADPVALCATIQRFGCTLMFGSPALVDVLGRHGDRHGVRLPSLRTVMSAGAPVAPDRVQRMLAMLDPAARLFTPYGATEALPVAVVEGAELLGEIRARTASGAGICVGRPVPGNTVRIIGITDEAITDWSGTRACATGEIGEITVRGPSVTAVYDARPAATALAKIRDADGAVVHRMGDLGYFDADGRLWFVGRKAERVQSADRTWFTECVEQVCNADPAVARAALVGLGPRPAQQPLVLIERLAGDTTAWPELEQRLRQRLAALPALSAIQRIAEYPGRFPVDVRHNAKIGRAWLAAWAARKLVA